MGLKTVVATLVVVVVVMMVVVVLTDQHVPRKDAHDLIVRQKLNNVA